MAGVPIRFIHAADLHLDVPVYGLAEPPEHLRELLIDAPHLAAEGVFDAALLEDVDFVVLSGDVLHLDPLEPRSMVFLLQQFERLAEQHIMVYWNSGEADCLDNWPDTIALPSNVRLFSTYEVEVLTHRRGDTAIANLVGGGVHSQNRLAAVANRAEGGELPAIGVHHGESRSDALQQKSIVYWALGGEHQHADVGKSGGISAHHAGSPQGRNPSETGPHGFLLVEISADEEVHAQHISTDAIRWRTEKLVLEEDSKQTDFSRNIQERMRNLTTEAIGRALLVQWRLTGEGLLDDAFRRKGFEADLLAKLRKDFGFADSPIWTHALKREIPAKLPEEWSEEDSILGDFLRAVRERQQSNKPLDLAPLLADVMADDELKNTLLADHPGSRAAILREATVLGVDLLRGQASRY